MKNIHFDGQLWQWDLDRHAHVSDFEPGDVLDVARDGSCDALTVEISEDGLAAVPNTLLRRPGTLRLWLRRDGETVDASAEPILERTKPADYLYVETPTIGYRQLEGRVAALEERMDAGGGGQRGTQVTVGDGVPNQPGIRGDSYIRSNGELWEYVETSD